MQYTTHYNLNLPEGTDIVNPLVQDNPNYSAIDTALYDNKVRVIGNATEVKSGTAHAITRSDSDIDVMRFTATGDWITGDTMTVDGSPVSVYLQDGTAPLTGAYIINTEVIAVINGSRVTLYGAQQLPGYTASDISYDDPYGIGNDVDAALDTLAGAAFKQLWTNTDRTSAFVAQTITLSSADYDCLVFEFASGTGVTIQISSCIIVSKGDNVFTSKASTSGSGLRVAQRTASYVDDTHYLISAESEQLMNNAESSDDTRLIPIRVLGFKKA